MSNIKSTRQVNLDKNSGYIKEYPTIRVMKEDEDEKVSDFSEYKLSD